MANNKVEVDEHITSYRQKQEAAQTKKDGVTKRTIDMSKQYDTAVLVFIGDWHIGTVDFDINEAIKVLDYVLQTPNAKLLCLGDMMNTAILNSVSNMFEDIAYPQEQWNVFVSLLEQVKEKLVVVHTGNHERRVGKNTGIDPVEQATKAIGAPETYAPYFADTYLSLKCPYVKAKRYSFPIVTHHGDSRNPENNSSVNQESFINAIGHTHQFKNYVKTKLIINKDGKRVKKDELNIVIPASGGGEYGFEKGYKPINRCPYYAIEITTVKNPLYDKSNPHSMEPPVIIATKSIAILTKAPSTYKEICIEKGREVIKKDIGEAKELLTKQYQALLETMKEMGEITNLDIEDVLAQVEKETKPDAILPERNESTTWYINEEYYKE